MIGLRILTQRGKRRRFTANFAGPLQSWAFFASRNIRIQLLESMYILLFRRQAPALSQAANAAGTSLEPACLALANSASHSLRRWARTDDRCVDEPYDVPVGLLAPVLSVVAGIGRYVTLSLPLL